jgi:hypothetical protein
MKRKMAVNTYTQAIQTIKNAILKSRYRAAALANRELLSLYYGIGKFISKSNGMSISKIVRYQRTI